MSETHRPPKDLRTELDAVESLLTHRRSAPEAAEAPLRKLLGVIEQLSASLEVDRVLNLAAARIIDIFAAERVFVLDVRVDGSVRFRLGASFDGAAIERPEAEVSHAVIREAAQGRKPILVRDAARDGRFANVSSVRNLQLHSVMAAPLLALGELKGVVYADNRRLAGAFTEESLDLLGLFANHVGIALHNAQTFQELNATRAELAQAERLKAIGQVASYVVHEIKNPLASVRLMVDALRTRAGDAAVMERFHQIVPHELDRLNRSVRDILEYARPTAMTRTPTRLEAVVKSALDTLAAEMENASVRVTTQIDGNLPAVLADPERLKGVVVNLLKNAREAVERTDRREVRCRVSRLDEKRLQIVIEDSGPGIPEADLPFLFEPFRTTKKLGTGLGLSFCQKIAREHGGAIVAENIPKTGARVRVTLPVSGA